MHMNHCVVLCLDLLDYLRDNFTFTARRYGFVPVKLEMSVVLSVCLSVCLSVRHMLVLVLCQLPIQQAEINGQNDATQR